MINREIVLIDFHLNLSIFTELLFLVEKIIEYAESPLIQILNKDFSFYSYYFIAFISIFIASHVFGSIKNY